MLFCVMKIGDSNFQWYLTIILIYRNWIYYFRSNVLPTVIILVKLVFFLDLFIVHSSIIIFGRFHFWCVVHCISFTEWSLVEF
jgi:hypothetical protein